MRKRDAKRKRELFRTDNVVAECVVWIRSLLAGPGLSDPVADLAKVKQAWKCFAQMGPQTASMLLELASGFLRIPTMFVDGRECALLRVCCIVR